MKLVIVKHRLTFILPFLVMLVAQHCAFPNLLQAGGEFSFEGQLSGIITKDLSSSAEQEITYARYLPQIQYVGADFFGSNTGPNPYKWDLVLAGNIYTKIVKGEIQKLDGKEHRAWLRLYDDNHEFRAGLQEITFGPAIFLRTLQWFDQKDPLDPTMFTQGVKAVLYRNYQENEANYWLWVLGGNKNNKMQGIYASDPKQAEFGGRVQWTFDTLELGLAAHMREVVVPFFTLAPKPAKVTEPENRVALDFKHDLDFAEVNDFSYWVEAERVEQKIGIDYNMTVGADTVLGTGDDYILMIEAHSRNNQIGVMPMEQNSAVALMLTKSDEMLDQYRAAISYAPNPKVTNLQIDWQRTYDDFLWDLGISTTKVEGLKATTGALLIVQYNH